MKTSLEFEALRRETSSWWYLSRRKLLRDALAQALRDRREARVPDYGCTADLNLLDTPGIRALSAHS
ncbi:MAG TPA: hypothetical protein VMD98_06825 [Bryocella sp.]|nr:hypothetical protein [Bryocella sp.]